jgi:hypothetical protein
MEFPGDKYSYQARLLPALIVVAPLALAVTVWFPTESTALKFFATFLFSFGITAILPHLARDLGKAKEPGLFRSWGGVPTTRMLSHRNSKLNAVTLSRYHLKFGQLIPGIEIPNARDESLSRSDSDTKYESCILFLREKTRDRKQFSMVFNENVNYGFRRNLWAAKPFGIATSAVGFGSCLVSLCLRHPSAYSSPLFGVVGLLVCFFLIVLWIFVFNPDWVRVAAEEYARRLIGAIEIL